MTTKSEKVSLVELKDFAHATAGNGWQLVANDDVAAETTVKMSAGPFSFPGFLKFMQFSNFSVSRDNVAQSPIISSRQPLVCGGTPQRSGSKQTNARRQQRQSVMRLARCLAMK